MNFNATFATIATALTVAAGEVDDSSLVMSTESASGGIGEDIPRDACSCGRAGVSDHSRINEAEACGVILAVIGSWIGALDATGVAGLVPKVVTLFTTIASLSVLSFSGVTVASILLLEMFSRNVLSKI